MLKKIKELFIPQQLLKGNCGIEREMLRVDKNGYECDRSIRRDVR